jgi:predicted PurR-regulated permease PerM
MEMKWKKAIGWLVGIALLVLLRRTLGRIALLLLVSATLAYLLYPLMRLYHQKLHLGEGLSTVLAFVSAALALTVFALFGVPALYRQILSLGSSMPQLLESFGSLVSRVAAALTDLGLPKEAVSAVQGQSGKLLTLGAQFLFGRLMLVVNGVSNLGYLIFAPVLSFYMLRDKRRLFSYLTRLIPSRVRRPVLRVGLSVRDAIGAYVHGQLTVSIITGALTGLGLLLIGLPSWMAMGVVMTVCNLIPYFGPWLGAIPIVLFSVTQGFPMVLGGIVVVMVAQQIEGLVVSPRVIGDMASLHPALVVLSLILGGWIAGLPGMFYSIPAVVSLRAVLNTLRDARLRV